ncbi:MAG: hypothetical protein ACI8XO_003313 [Verrucomicrobiales bacterium]|jgi:hypothetical protein
MPKDKPRKDKPDSKKSKKLGLKKPEQNATKAKKKAAKKVAKVAKKKAVKKAVKVASKKATKKAGKKVAKKASKKVAAKKKAVAKKVKTPPNPEPSDSEINQKAYEIYREREGAGEDGNPLGDWEKARQILRGDWTR